MKARGGIRAVAWWVGAHLASTVIGAPPVEVALLPDRFAGGSLDQVVYKGRPALRLGPDDGLQSILREVRLLDGVIEADIAAESTVGLLFRCQSERRYESVGLNPSDKPRRADEPNIEYRATGFIPSVHSIGQTAAGPLVPKGEWFTLRLVLRGSRLEVFVDDMPSPALVVDPLRGSGLSGSIGFFGRSAYLARFEYTRMD